MEYRLIKNKLVSIEDTVIQKGSTYIMPGRGNTVTDTFTLWYY